MKLARNAPCPCGSGRKYKRCCLASEREAAAAIRRQTAVGHRLTRWAASELRDEYEFALQEFAGPQKLLVGDDVDLFAAWFHNDRQLADGATPAERYAARPGLDPLERETAARIASARLGIYRVLAVEPGRLLELLDLTSRARVRVESDNVSTEAVRWDVLLGRVMTGEPLSLWGPVRICAAAEEEELLEELRRLAAGSGLGETPAELARALRAHPLELTRFQSPSHQVERSYYTLEGDPIAQARAIWRVDDPAAARLRLAELGGYDPDETAGDGAVEVEITVPRSVLVAERPELPPGAVVVEMSSAPRGDPVAVATVKIEASLLSVDAMSARRLENALAIVVEDFADVIEGAPECEVMPIGEHLAEREAEPPPARLPAAGLDEVGPEAALGEFLRERYRHWLDEPNPALRGSTPREAAAAGRGAEVVPLVRAVENGAARSARDHEEIGELELLEELGLEGDELAA